MDDGNPPKTTKLKPSDITARDENDELEYSLTWLVDTDWLPNKQTNIQQGKARKGIATTMHGSCA